jgi:hypothetical protein
VVKYALVVCIACGHSPTPPPPSTGSAVPADAAVEIDAPVALDQDLPRLAQRAAKMFADVAAAFATAGEDCTAATTMLRSLAATHADVVAANHKVVRDGRGMQLKLALRDHEQQLDAAAKSIMTGKTMAACATDEAFVKAYDELVSPP